MKSKIKTMDPIQELNEYFKKLSEPLEETAPKSLETEFGLTVEPYAFWDGTSLVYLDPADPKNNTGKMGLDVGDRHLTNMDDIAFYARNMKLYSVKVNGNIFVTNERLLQLKGHLINTFKAYLRAQGIDDETIEKKLLDWLERNKLNNIF